MAYGAGQHYAVLGLSEIGLAAADYPLCLMKDADTGRFTVAALLGFAPGRNLFVVDGRWLATWVPGTLLRYPFYQDETAPHGLAIDIASRLLSRTTGEPLFEAGVPTARVGQIAGSIAALVADVGAAQGLIAALLDARLVRPLELVLTGADGRENEIDGVYSISVDALAELEDGQVLALHHGGYLGPAHGIAASLAQLERLRQLSDHQGGSPIAHLAYRVID